MDDRTCVTGRGLGTWLPGGEVALSWTPTAAFVGATFARLPSPGQLSEPRLWGEGAVVAVVGKYGGQECGLPWESCSVVHVSCAQVVPVR